MRPCGSPGTGPPGRPTRRAPSPADSCAQAVDAAVDSAVETSYAQGINNGCPVDDKRILTSSPKGLVLPTAEAVEILSPLKAGSARGNSGTLEGPGNRRRRRGPGTSGAGPPAVAEQSADQGSQARRGPSISYMEGPRRFGTPQ